MNRLKWPTPYSEQHVEIRIQSMLEEAKTKKAKGDEGGQWPYITIYKDSCF